MKIKALILIPVSLLTLALAGCVSTPEVGTEETEVKEEQTKEVKKSVDEKAETVNFEGISLEVPKTYTELPNDEDVGFPYILYQFGAANSFNVLVEDVSDYPGITLEEYVALTKVGTGFEYTREEYFTLNEIEMNQLETAEMEGAKIQQTTIIHEGKAYIFTYASLKETFQSDRIQSILKSVSLTKYNYSHLKGECFNLNLLPLNK